MQSLIRIHSKAFELLSLRTKWHTPQRYQIYHFLVELTPWVLFYFDSRSTIRLWYHLVCFILSNSFIPVFHLLHDYTFIQLGFLHRVLHYVLFPLFTVMLFWSFKITILYTGTDVRTLHVGNDRKWYKTSHLYMFIIMISSSLSIFKRKTINDWCNHTKLHNCISILFEGSGKDSLKSNVSVLLVLHSDISEAGVSQSCHVGLWAPVFPWHHPLRCYRSHTRKPQSCDHQGSWVG